MNKMYEELLPVEVLAAESTVAAAADVDTSRLSFNRFRRIMFYLTIDADDRDAWIDDQILTLSLHESAVITGGVTNEVVADIDVVGGQNMLECEIWVEGHADGDNVVVNGVTFERTTAGYAVARPLEWNTPTQLYEGINANCVGITALAAAATHGVPVSVDEPGTMTLNVEMNIVGATAQLATMKVCAVVEAYASQFAQKYVFLNIDNAHATADLDGAVDAYCVAIKGSPYHSPVNHVAAVVG